MEWTRDRIVSLIQTNDKAVERGIIAIYKRQTLDEQASSDTKHHNSVGFSSAHARLGTYYAKWCLSGKRLSGEHLEKCRKIVLRYVGQLMEEANA